MLSAQARSRLTVVLVGARNPSNIGAAARAMQDFGFLDLRVVNPFLPPFEAAQIAADATATELPAGELGEVKSAVGAGSVMRAARRFDDLAEAIADCTLILGTTAIGERGLAQPVLTLRDGAPAVIEALKSGVTTESAPRVALLFGSEKTGLTRQQLSFCTQLLTIPLLAPEGERHLSMNLGQSVAVVLYELVRGGFEGAREIPIGAAPPATTEDRERLLRLLREVMEHTGYARRFPANAREAVVRQLVASLGTTHLEAMTWMGLLKQMTKANV